MYNCTFNVQSCLKAINEPINSVKTEDKLETNVVQTRDRMVSKY